MYIALKNTEYKEVYKKEDFIKNNLDLEGISIKSFNENELDRAFDWAGVSSLSIPDSSVQNNNNPKKTLVSLEKNPVVNLLNNLMKRGVDGVCISTRHLGDLIIKLNPVYYLCVNDNGINHFAEAGRWNISSLLDKTLEADVSRWNNSRTYKYHMVEIPYTSSFKSLNEIFINLRNFWGKVSTNDINPEAYNIEELLDFEHMNDYEGFPGMYHFVDEYYLNINDIIGVKEIFFNTIGDSYLIPNNVHFDYAISLNKSEHKNVMEILKHHNVESLYEYTHEF